MHDNQQGAEREKQEDQQELGVRHELPRRRQAFRGYQQGVLAAVFACVVSSALAAVAGWSTPLETPAEWLMEWTPVPIADFLLLRLGAVARPAALLGALAITMLLGGVGGAIWALFGCRLGQQLLGFLTAGGFLAVAFFALFAAPAPWPVLALIAAYLVGLALLSQRSRSLSGRRELLTRSGIVLGGAAAILAFYAIRPLLTAASAVRLFVYRPPRGLRIPGLTALVTPADAFYRMDKVLELPAISRAGWKLRIGGEVVRPLQVDLHALMRYPARQRYITLECVDNPVGGPLISTALWTGVPVAGLLALAGARGDTVIFHSADGYSEDVPRRLLEAAGALIAYGMNGETLPRAHGYPARLVLPGIYGFKSVKWLTRMEVVTGPQAGTWQAHGWTDEGTVQTTTRIDVARRRGEEVLLAGVAFAGSHGISGVEVRANGGRWRRATLGPALSRDAWVQWALRFRGSGPAHFEARAIDGEGRAQPASRHDAYPDGATGWATIDL